ncbi:hypothetical protein FGG08_006908 [Glutinoglossum americanum]|uniref:C2H2-type domain-containing protein n=1 Tax=Glutinoglossum americanum TaxID=1670608 RepID=A0A9P8HXC3_9PEZI|nr:hypothetical protein FGG08_006908 [Glutinoglossum americanum]
MPRPSSSSTDRHPPPVYNSRTGRNRPDLSFLGLGGNGNGNTDRDPVVPEGRRETKVEREARRAERERILREKERERSMKEESVDGGYLVTQGVYTGTEDFNKAVVRQLMIERRLAPFFKGLENHSGSWKDRQLVAAVRGLPIPAADDAYEVDELAKQSKPPPQQLASLTVPITSRSRAHSYTSTSDSSLPSHPTFSLPSNPTSPPPSSSSQFRPRSKTIASLTTKSADGDMVPLEVHLPEDPYVDGRPLEAVLYKEAIECPICFLYYPPYLNKTRCCDQPICSECFVQIKRPDPHPPEHSDPTPPNLGGASSQSREATEDGALVSEPAACPFCVQPEFGVTFEPPPFRRGSAYANQSFAHPLASASSAMSSSSSLSSFPGSGSSVTPNAPTSRRRTTSISASASTVITTDKIRPDWAQKLANARSHAARRAAAATALHTAAYLMNNGNSSEVRGFGGFGRRGGLVRRSAMGNDSPGSASGTGTPRGGEERISFTALAAMAERQGSSSNRGDLGTLGASLADGMLGRVGGDLASRRRTRMMDLEDMMLMEAIRLSLAEEEERKKKEEKEEKKNAKKKEKENKKAAKRGLSFGVGNESSSSAPPAAYDSGNCSPTFEEATHGDTKGKSVDRSGTREPGSAPSTLRNAVTEEASSRAKLLPSPMSGSPFASHGATETCDYQAQPPHHLHPSAQNASQPFHPSHLRHMSNTSSSASSIDSAPGSLRSGIHAFEGSPNTSGLSLSHGHATYDHPDSFRSATPPGGGAGTEPMFNFRSLAAVIGDEEKEAEANHIEHPASAHDSKNIGESSDMRLSSLQTDGYTMDDSTITLKAPASSSGTSNTGFGGLNVSVPSGSNTEHKIGESHGKYVGSVEVVATNPSPATAG